jgi:hypothetical protein
VAHSKEQWKGAAVHSITLPSGAKVDIKLPDLAQMIKGGQIPNELLEVAQKVGSGQSIGDALASEEQKEADKEKGVSKELIGQISEFHAFLVASTVVEPVVTKEEALTPGFLPAEDLAVIVQFALRERDFDAVGHHLGGLETVPEFRQFRGLDTSVADILGSSGGA